jgi:hypothetical protein
MVMGSRSTKIRAVRKPVGLERAVKDYEALKRVAIVWEMSSHPIKEQSLKILYLKL